MPLSQSQRSCRIRLAPALRRAACIAAAAILLFAGLPAQAERTRFWRQSSYEEFEKGTAKGVALRSDGKLVLAPRFAQFSDPNAAYLWAVHVDSKGNLYAAGGSNAKVVRFDDKGQATTVFESQEMSAQAMAFDAQDNLYVGTSPDGKVYKVTPRGERSVFFEPKTKYIWDLAIDSAGTLYVATGDKGEIFAVTPEGKSQVYYKSEEMHVRALSFDAKGHLIIGTEPNGLILRVEKAATQTAAAAQAETRRGFVIYETPSKEVTALVVDRAGNIYAAAIGVKTRVPPTPPVPTTTVVQPTVTTAAPQVAVGVPATVQQPTPFLPFPPITGGSQVFRITPEGAPEELWSSRDDLVYSLGMSPEGKLLVGTGNRGVLVQLEGNRVFSNLAKMAAAQVTGLTSGPGGKVFVSTANPGQVFTLGPGYEAEGTYDSQAFDAKMFSQWGVLTWWGENGATDGQVSFFVRSGNTSDPEKNWSPWAGPYANAKGENIASPSARFAQWRAVFRATKPAEAAKPATRPGETPNVSWVSVAYLPKNLAPSVESIVIQNPGVRVQGFQSPQQQQQQPVQLKMPPPAVAGQPGAVAAPQPAQPQRFEPPPQGFAQKGFQGVVWSARDDNDDDLTFSIYYRGEGEKNWKLLKEKLDQKFYSWDTTTMPDGAYYLKIVASDEPANPPGDALSAERESDRFEVDNTPPRVENLRLESTNPEVRIKFDAHDTYSTLARAEYSLNAGDWKLVFPVGRTTDAPQESYEMVLGNLTPGEHTLAVRVYDQFENSASAKITFVIEPPKKR